jgi:hypothetical protein
VKSGGSGTPQFRPGKYFRPRDAPATPLRLRTDSAHAGAAQRVQQAPGDLNGEPTASVLHGSLYFEGELTPRDDCGAHVYLSPTSTYMAKASSEQTAAVKVWD